MNYKKQILINIAVSITVMFLSFCLIKTYPNGLQACEISIAHPNSYSTEIPVCPLIIIINYLSIFSFAVFILSFIFLFTKEEVYRAWKRFSFGYAIMAILLLFGSPASTSSGFSGLSMSISRSNMSFFLLYLFLIISLILIAYKSIKLRGK
jgi:hypothetical protein